MFGVCPLKYRVTWGIMIGKITSPMCGTLMFMVTNPCVRRYFGVCPLMFRVTWGIMIGKVTSPMCTTLILIVAHPCVQGCLGMHPVYMIVGDYRWIHHVRHPNAYGDTPI